MNSIARFVERQAQREVPIWVVSVFDDEAGVLREIAERYNVVPEHGVEIYRDHTEYIFPSRDDAENFTLDESSRSTDFVFLDIEHDYMVFRE